MTASRYVNIWCDAEPHAPGCPEWCDDGMAPFSNASDSRAGARAMGWAVNKPGGMDYSPQCWAFKQAEGVSS